MLIRHHTQVLRLVTRPLLPRALPKLIPRSFAIPQIRGLTAKTKSINDIFMGDNIVNFYAGQPPLNRLSWVRPSAGTLNAHLHNDKARFIAFKEFKPLVKKESPGELHFLSFKDVESRVGPDWQAPQGADADSKDRKRLFESARLPHTLPALVFLGIDDRPDASKDSVPAQVDPRNPQGVPYFAIDAGKEDWVVEGAEFGDARASASSMSGWEAGVFAQARALIDWNCRNLFCAACGSRTYSLWGGWKRSCTTAIDNPDAETPCFSTKGLHNFAYPRTDPVIIMGILDPTGESMLMGRQKSWPKGMYSCLAGFVEPGESFEDAVRREVLEEAGVDVGPVRYSSSQPWPYPANLMVGCFGRAKPDQTIRLDLDNELEDAQFFPRSLIAKLVGTEAGQFLSKADLKQLDKSQTDKESEAALAPSEGRGEVGQGEKMGLTRVPPDSAIAGQLIRLWAAGGVELVSKL